LQERRRDKFYPFVEGTAEKSPVERLNLQPGELVEVRSKEEIMATLDKSQRNRGLWFDSEMLPYCGGIYRVLRRVHQIVDEKTGKMVNMKNPCIVLEGVVCKSDFHRLCPRAIILIGARIGSSAQSTQRPRFQGRKWQKSARNR